MDTKTEIKEESPVSVAASENEREFFSKEFARKINTDGTLNDDCELEPIIKIKVEDSFLDLHSENELEAFPEEILNEFQNETLTCSADYEIDLKAEAAPVSDLYSTSERGDYPKDCVIKVENCSNLDNEGETKLEMKEEPWWPESLSADPPSVYVTKDGTNDHSPPEESPRSCMEEDSGDSSDKPAVLSDKDISFNTRKDDPEFEKGRNRKINVTKTVHSEHLECHDGGKMCNVAANLKQNNLVQQNNEIYKNINKRVNKCDICEKNFTKPSSLKRHNMIHEGKMPYKCQICEKNFKDLSTLKRHNMIHVGIKPYKCDICEKNFRDLWNLKTHNFIHNRQKPYKCEICEKDFTVLSSLKRHNLIHEGKKPHKCNICEKGFIEISHLKRHNLIHENRHNWIHEGKASYKCDICGKEFTYLSNLKAHNLIHEDKRPYKCSICEKSFARLLALKTHSYMSHERKKAQ